jgi:hypothetical protein
LHKIKNVILINSRIPADKTLIRNGRKTNTINSETNGFSERALFLSVQWN